MHFQFVVAPPSASLPNPTAGSGNDAQVDLLRELIEIGREQVAYLRAAHESHSNIAKWQLFLARWGDEFPEAGESCLRAVPQVERAFMRILDEATRRLTEEDADDLENEFALAEFLDRYGMRMAQLGNVLNIMGPLADAARAAMQTSEP